MTDSDLSGHLAAVAANNALLKANEYDFTESVDIRKILLTKNLLEFDFSTPIKRKGASETVIPLGDITKPACGYSLSDLPNPDTFTEDYPNSIFKPGMKLLDFACGTGIITELYLPYVKGGEVIGIDINDDFLNKFDQRSKKNNNAMKGFNIDLLLESVDFKVDAIICTLSYHHIDNYEKITTKLVNLLNPGGWLVIVDFYNEDVESIDITRPINSAVRHMGGLKIDNLERILNENGLVNVSAAREFNYHSWEHRKFIETHLTQDIIDKMNQGDLESKKEHDYDVYHTQQSIIMAIGQRK